MPKPTDTIDALNDAFARSLRDLGLGGLAAGGSLRSHTDGIRRTAASTRNLSPHGDRIPMMHRGEVVVPPEQMQRFIGIDPAQRPDETAISFMGMRIIESPLVEEPTIVNRDMPPEQMTRLTSALDEAIARTFQIPERLLRSGTVTNQLPPERDSALTAEMLESMIADARAARASHAGRLPTDTSVKALQVPAKPLPPDNGGKRRINVRRRK